MVWLVKKKTLQPKWLKPTWHDHVTACTHTQQHTAYTKPKQKLHTHTHATLTQTHATTHTTKTQMHRAYKNSNLKYINKFTQNNHRKHFKLLLHLPPLAPSYGHGAFAAVLGSPGLQRLHFLLQLLEQEQLWFFGKKGGVGRCVFGCGCCE